MFLRMFLPVVLMAGPGYCVTDTQFSRKFKCPIAGSASIDTSTTRSLIGCSKSCSEHSKCRSIIYDPSSRECQRHNKYYASSNSIPDPIPGTTAVYYEREGVPCVPPPFVCPAPTETSFIKYCDQTFSFRLYFDITRTFPDAKVECESQSGQLIEIQTVEKMNFSRQLVLCQDYSLSSFWVDGEYNEATSRYETSKGEPLPLDQGTYFVPGRPGTLDVDRCIRIDPDKNHLLEDDPCSTTFYMICEKP